MLAMVGDPADRLVGGGEMAKVIRPKDWSTSPLGPIERWPQSLRTASTYRLAGRRRIGLHVRDSTHPWIQDSEDPVYKIVGHK